MLPAYACVTVLNTKLRKNDWEHVSDTAAVGLSTKEMFKNEAVRTGQMVCVYMYVKIDLWWDAGTCLIYLMVLHSKGCSRDSTVLPTQDPT